MRKLEAIEAFDKLVRLKYELYNNLFLTLPFPNLKEVGIKLPIFAEWCDNLLGQSPIEIVDRFFKENLHIDDFDKKMDILFLFSQFIERQVILFDALEQASFSTTHPIDQSGSLDLLLIRYQEEKGKNQLHEILNHTKTRVVVTAHPTQFYPETLLNIIDRLSEAVKTDDLIAIEEILLQLGMTSFINPEAPTPLSEAENLIRRTHKIFYDAFMQIEKIVDKHLNDRKIDHPIIEFGFWPGGDRDGNPFVNVETTMTVARKLKKTALKLYQEEIKLLKEKLTFPGLMETVAQIEREINHYPNAEDLLKAVQKLKKENKEHYNGLFIHQIERLERAIKTFGYHFASLDLRQDSSIHEEVIIELFNRHTKEKQWPKNSLAYSGLSSEEKTKLLEEIISNHPPIKHRTDSDDTMTKDVLDSLKAMETIQKENGKKGMERVIISNTQGPEDVLEILFFHSIINAQTCSFDIIPLFETIDDLKRARAIMERLFRSTIYQSHIKKRNQRQVVMLGFSDGTKDGGYLTCNWNIFKTKKELAQLAKKSGIDIVFFDGRGGPPARGGGNTHKFYRAVGDYIDQREIQLTIQGQTISSKFGTYDSALYNLEQVITAGIEPRLFHNTHQFLSDQDITFFDELSESSYKSYMELRQDPLFIKFIEEKTPLKYYTQLNIASRPAKRGKTKNLELHDLRAISFVGAWSQIKLNVPGFYGLGTALEKAWNNGQEKHLHTLYRENLFFSTLINNAMQSLAKTNLLYTAHLFNHEVFGNFIKKIHEEAETTKKYILLLSGHNKLMDAEPLTQNSIKLREQLIMPLVIIQQWAQISLEHVDDEKMRNTLEKLLLKTLPPIINAARNSA
ncbi:MAG: phosphoenolpyruvate carboxylase [Chlamydiota bacterium]|nr:phosphoenolpyruvate carboxylase [Chlamydiota bacterium]